MRYIYTIIAILWAFPVIGQQVSIGNGTLQNFLPVNVGYYYTYSQQIYKGSEIGYSGTITGLKFYLPPSANIDKSNEWIIYLGQTTKTAFNSVNDWVSTSNMTQVYSGTVVNNNGVVTVNLTPSFSFDHNNYNLVVAVDENKSGYNGTSNQFYEHTATSNSSICFFSDTYNMNPDNIPSNKPGILSPNRSNITFEGIGPTCVIPTNLSTTNIGGTYATISWTPPNPVPANGYEYYVSDSNTPPTGSGTATSSSSIDLINLNTNTTYYFWVRSVCDNNEYSSWAGPSSFTTFLCNPVIVPYDLDFESASPPALPECTSVQQAGSGNLWKTSPVGGSSGFSTNCLRYLTNYTDPANTWFYTQGLSLEAGQSYTISYKYGAYTGTEKLKIAIGNNPVNTDMNTTLADHPDIATSPLFNSVDFTVPADGTYFIGFQCYSDANEYFLNVDDILVIKTPTCFPPTALTASEITMTSAHISWTPPEENPSGGYEYYISTNTTPPTGSGTSTSQPSADLTDLTQNTIYYYWVRSYCGGTDYSAWSEMASFVTQSQTGIPWNESFPDNNIIPTGWTLESSWHVGSINGVSGNPPYNIFSSFNSGNNSSSYSTINVGPIESGNKLSFDYKAAKSSSPYGPAGNNSGYFILYISTDQGLNYTILDSITNGNQSGWITKIYPLDSYSGQLVKLKITGKWINGSWDYGFDNFNIVSCPEPFSLSASAITQSTATIEWSAPNPNPSYGYEYYYATSNTPPSGNGTPSTGTSANLTDLMSATTYYFWVRSKCDGDEYSGWSGPENFTTLCDPGSIPFMEGFETNQTNTSPVAGCFTQQNISGTSPWIANTASSYYREPRTGTYNAYLKYSNEDWLFYPITLTGGTSYKFSIYARQDGSNASNASITLAYGTSNNAASMTNIVVNAQGVVNGDYQKVMGTFTPSAGGDYYLGIKGYINSIPLYLSIDDISVTLNLPCLAPDNLSSSDITSTSSTISWDEPENVPANGYEYYYSTSNTPPSGPGTSNADLDVVLNSLNPNTTYYFWVRSHCEGSEFSDWSSAQSFTTKVSNDEATGATTLTVGAGCSSATYTNVNSSINPIEPLGLSLANFSTVWFSFTAPSSGAVRVSTDDVSGSLTNTRIAIYSTSNPADYSTYMPISADEDGGVSPGLNAVTYAVNLTPGQTYYIQVDQFDATTQSGTFCIKVDQLSSSMLSSSAACQAFEPIPGSNISYKGWLNIIESTTGKLMMQVRRINGGVSPASYSSGYVDIATNGIRQTPDGLFYLDRDFVLNNTFNPQPSGNYDLRFFFLQSERNDLAQEDGNASSLANLNITRDPGISSCVHNAGPSGTDNQLLTQTANGATNGAEWIQVSSPGFSRFFINTGSIPLPVNILSFEARKISDSKVLLSWLADNEVNLDSYLAERSADGHTFRLLTSVSPSNLSSYSFTDLNPEPGTNYYRLKMLDKDGSVQYSQIRQVKFSKKPTINLFPNPSSGTCYLSGLEMNTAPFQINIFNSLGQQIKQITTTGKNEKTIEINLSECPPGIYFIKLLNESFQRTIYFTLSK